MRSGAVGVMMHLARAVPVMVAPEQGGLWKGGEEREAGAGSWHCSYTFSWRRMAPWSRGIRVRPQRLVVYTPLVLPLPLLVATVQLTQIQRRRAARAHYCS